MTTRDFSLSPHFDEYIDAAIASGRYQNASEHVRDSLRLHAEREHERQWRIEALRAALQVCEADLAHGRYVVIDSAEELDAWMDELRVEVEAEFVASPARGNE